MQRKRRGRTLAAVLAGVVALSGVSSALAAPRPPGPGGSPGGTLINFRANAGTGLTTFFTGDGMSLQAQCNTTTPSAASPNLRAVATSSNLGFSASQSTAPAADGEDLQAPVASSGVTHFSDADFDLGTGDGVALQFAPAPQSVSGQMNLARAGAAVTEIVYQAQVVTPGLSPQADCVFTGVAVNA